MCGHRAWLTSPTLRLLALTLGICAAGLGGTTAAALAAAPTVTGVQPDSGPAAGGTPVAIEGTGFTTGASVSFAGNAATDVKVLSPTSLTAISPPGSGTLNLAVQDSGGSSPAVAHDWFSYEIAPDGLWLGLDSNSSSNRFNGEWLGPVNEFSSRGIVYDRTFELTAGALPGESEEDTLELDHEYGMTPVIPIEYSGYKGDLTPDPYFPQAERTSGEAAEGKTTIAQYAAGFIRSASAILTLVSQKYPGMPILLEAMNEPWGYTTPLDNGAEYAQVLAALLPQARAAGIPLTDIYASAFGADQRLNEKGEPEYFTPGWVPAIYAAEPSLETEIQGWYFHPYGPPSGTEFFNSWGIQSVPEVRRQMRSGENNIIVSEIGFCARSEGGECDETGEAEVETRAEAATRLTAMLENARPYYEAGWLKALLVYGRGTGGWSMVEYPSKQLSKQGEALEAFALLHAKSEPPEEPPPHQEQLSSPALQPLSSAVAALTAGTAPAPSTPSPILASPLVGRVALLHSLIAIRGGIARIGLRCQGIAPCKGSIELQVQITSNRGRRRRSHNVTLGSGAFSLRPGTQKQISLRVSSLHLPRTRDGLLDALLMIEPSSPGLFTPLHTKIRLGVHPQH